MAQTPLIPVVITSIGAYLAWFGVHYWRSDVTWPSDPVKAVLTGKTLPDNTRNDAQATAKTINSALNTTGGQVGSAIGGGAVAVVGNVIAETALKYKGAGYVWGGNASTVGNWDCSSFVSFVLHQCGLPLPGGKWGDPGFPPRSHGPTTLDYMLFGTGVSLANIQAGDLIVSTEHIGIAISSTQMISAESPSSGTGVAGFPGGFPAGPPIYRRVTSGST
jgi:cell wall-associated NlpC family hydrolase